MLKDLRAIEIMGILETGPADNINVNRQSRSINSVLIKLVSLRVMIHPQCLFPAVDIARNMTEEDGVAQGFGVPLFKKRVMLLESSSELHRIVVVVVLYRIAPCLVVLLLDKQVGHILVNNMLVLRLGAEKEGFGRGSLDKQTASAGRKRVMLFA